MLVMLHYKQYAVFEGICMSMSKKSLRGMVLSSQGLMTAATSHAH